MKHYALIAALISCAEVCRLAYYESACGSGDKTTCQCVETIERRLDNVIPFSLTWKQEKKTYNPDENDYYFDRGERIKYESDKNSWEDMDR